MKKMMKKQERRIESFLPEGKPKFVRIYDNGGETADRFTVVFTGRYGHKTGNETWIIGMCEAPYSPQGVCLHSPLPYNERPDFPTYGHLGKKIKFDDLPKDCQKVVLEDYKYLWDLSDEIPANAIDPFAVDPEVLFGKGLTA